MKNSFNDFSGGITDFRFNTASNFSETMDNWLINRDKSMEVRYGFRFLDINYPRITMPQRINAIRDINDLVTYFSNGDIYYIDNGMQKLLGPSGNKIFNNAQPNTITDIAKWGDHYICTDDDYSFPIKVFRDQNGELKAVNAGLPRIPSLPVVTPSITGSESYSYAFIYSYEYRIGTTLFLDYSEPIYVNIQNGNDMYSGQIDISNIAELTNGANRNYDLLNVKKRIYRTEDNGTTYYFVGEIDNNVTTFTDSTNNDDLTAGEVLYTQGGIKANELPPQAKYVAIASNVAWYGNVIESAEVKPYRLRFSKESDIDSCPATFFEDFESAITGLSSIENKVIVFTEDKTIRLEGILDDVGRGVIDKDTIADVPCVSNGSIVTTKDWVYWFGDSGIYRTNGIQYEKLTNHLDKSYQEWTQSDQKKRRISGAYDNVNQRVYWCISVQDADNDKILVFDEIHQGFSTMSSGNDFSPTAILFKDQEMIRGDKDGYIFVHREDIFSDLVKNQFKAPADWDTKVIPYDWKHIAWDFGDAEKVKWLTKINVTGRPETNVYLEPRSYREGAVEYYALSDIRFNPLIKWGDPTILWGEPANRWNSVDYLNAAKRMNRRAKRATHVQLSLASAEVKILSSGNNADSYVIVNGTTKQIALSNPGVYKFSLNNEGHSILIDGKRYEITDNSDSVVIVDDPENTLPTGTYAYEIIGKPKAQRPHISNVAIYFEFFGEEDKLTESVA